MVKQDGKVRALSRNFKPIPNVHVRQWLEENCPEGFDGELVTGSTFQETSSAIMSRNGKPEFMYRVFDWYSEKAYCDRMQHLLKYPPNYIVNLVLPSGMDTVEDLLQYEEFCLTEGYEGVMVRNPFGPYKFGRSTEKEGYLLKIKRFTDAEAVIVGYEEKMHNDNEAELDELGRTKRSSHKANQVPMGTLGALLVRGIGNNDELKVEFRIGSGFTDEMRRLFWAQRDQLKGKIVKFKYQPTGVLEKPRFPIFLGLRSSLDQA